MTQPSPSPASTASDVTQTDTAQVEADENQVEALLATAFGAAVAAWLASAATAVATPPVPDLSLIPDVASFIRRATADALRTLRRDLPADSPYRRHLGQWAAALPYRLDGLQPLAWRRTTRALADADAAHADVAATRRALRTALDPDRYSGYVDRLAQTEATRLVNEARHEQALRHAFATGRTLTKTWRTRRDNRVRHSHREVEGVTVGLTEPFRVDGWPMMFPGDEAAPPAQTANCRCIVLYHTRGTV